MAVPIFPSARPAPRRGFMSRSRRSWGQRWRGGRRGRRVARAGKPGVRLFLNTLEARLTPNNYIVNVAADPAFTPSLVNSSTGQMGDGVDMGDVSLRSALSAVNLNSGTHTIGFKLTAD